MPRILYIEDNRDNRMLVRRVLMASDYDFIITEADNAYRGIELAQADPPDLILMDLSMPEMDGLTATQRLRAIPALGSVPIIALTANAMQGDKERSLQAGCDGYISKPIDVDKIADDVNALLSIRRKSTPPAAADTTSVLTDAKVPTVSDESATLPTDGKVSTAAGDTESVSPDAKVPTVTGEIASLLADGKVPTAAGDTGSVSRDGKVPSEHA